MSDTLDVKIVEFTTEMAVYQLGHLNGVYLLVCCYPMLQAIGNLNLPLRENNINIVLSMVEGVSEAAT